MITIEIIELLTLLCYVFLYAAVLFLWLPCQSRIPIWGVTAALSIVCGLASKLLDWDAIFPIIALAVALHYNNKRGVALWRTIAGTAALFLSLGLGAHLFPYFHNLKVLSSVQISADGMPFTMYLNIDKAFVGLFILASSRCLIKHREEWNSMCKTAISMMLMCTVVLILFAVCAGKIRFDPKIPECTVIWLINNLLFVCVAEEAFFRGFIQKKLEYLLANFKWGSHLALAIASLLFGMAHYAGGFAYNIMGLIAGVGYGLVYQQTRRIEASILTHFGLNTIHFLFFTYPAIG